MPVLNTSYQRLEHAILGANILFEVAESREFMDALAQRRNRLAKIVHDREKIFHDTYKDFDPAEAWEDILKAQNEQISELPQNPRHQAEYGLKSDDRIEDKAGLEIELVAIYNRGDAVPIMDYPWDLQNLHLTSLGHRRYSLARHHYKEALERIDYSPDKSLLQKELSQPFSTLSELFEKEAFVAGETDLQAVEDGLKELAKALKQLENEKPLSSPIFILEHIGRADLATLLTSNDFMMLDLEKHFDFLEEYTFGADYTLTEEGITSKYYGNFRDRPNNGEVDVPFFNRANELRIRFTNSDAIASEVSKLLDCITHIHGAYSLNIAVATHHWHQSNWVNGTNLATTANGRPSDFMLDGIEGAAKNFAALFAVIAGTGPFNMAEDYVYKTLEPFYSMQSLADEEMAAQLNQEAVQALAQLIHNINHTHSQSFVGLSKKPQTSVRITEYGTNNVHEEYRYGAEEESAGDISQLKHIILRNLAMTVQGKLYGWEHHGQFPEHDNVLRDAEFIVEGDEITLAIQQPFTFFDHTARGFGYRYFPEHGLGIGGVRATDVARNDIEKSTENDGYWSTIDAIPAMPMFGLAPSGERLAKYMQDLATINIFRIHQKEVENEIEMLVLSAPQTEDLLSQLANIDNTRKRTRQLYDDLAIQQLSMDEDDSMFHIYNQKDSYSIALAIGTFGHSGAHHFEPSA